jgi:hypothetical protein
MFFWDPGSEIRDKHPGSATLVYGRLKLAWFCLGRVNRGGKLREVKGAVYEEGAEQIRKRRKIQDMSQVFKILTGIDKVDSDKIFAR